MKLGQIFVYLFIAGGIFTQARQPRCEQGSCYPVTGDLLIGRQKQLTASSTCGLTQPQAYCIVSHLEDEEKCFTCDSRQPYNTPLNGRRRRGSHRIENIVSSFGRSASRRRWWQAENGKENVYIQLNLEAEFHFTHLIMTFKTFRPAAMLVERSYDFGRTWKVYRYFAKNCQTMFPRIPHRPAQNINDVICESRYSDVAPSTSGEVIFRVLPPSIAVKDPYSPNVQDQLKLTNLRINFTKLNTLGDVLLDHRQETKKKYYYALYEMVVRGSCSCYGHASRCVPVSGNVNNKDMVNGKCECAHNTKGLNCEECEDFYNDLPWRPARTRQPNDCKKCNCNNHATKCHFDPAVYELTGRQSGGVCDGCQHNTMGRNCEECKPFYYRDPNRDIRDPNICQPCDCDPSGSDQRGECHGYTSEHASLEAGTCVCKRYVEGRRCDRCREGFWNLQQNNPDGCEPCSCNQVGVLQNYGCDRYNGLCRCKRYVTGRQCDQCFPGYWGMSMDINGCRACDCDIGGALGETCDQRTGQCQCRLHIHGRKCDRPLPGYFYAGLDFNRYEAEYGRGIGNAQIYIREQLPDADKSWTGRGYMKVMEGDSIEFTINDIRMSTDYDIIIRYDPRMPDRWEDVRVMVVRPSAVDQRGPCANSIPQDDYKAASLQPGSRYTVVHPSSCLEKGVTYTIRLNFYRYKSERPTPSATTLIDSIVLMPSTNSIPIFQGSFGEPLRIREEFERYRCREIEMPAVQSRIPEVCRQHIFSISAVIHQKAIACECDPTGSLSSECVQLGGQCQCKPNVVGRKCDQCAPGTFGFGPRGCSPCNCSPDGSRENFCEVQSGQCLCIPNAFGRSCDQCESGYWNFPHCQPCECNGNAEICNNTNGHCINCREFTSGINCDTCQPGYYRNPRITTRIACQPCLCPGGPGSALQRADFCAFDSRSQTVPCDCHRGYTGTNCNQCAENYFGDASNGVCQPCNCNNNVDLSRSGNCNADSGECLQCLYHTEGFSCERCMDHYYGDALQQNCKECVCDAIGTDFQGGFCDKRTGQCPCLQNVVGQQCDRCATDFWNLASGQGCEACQCDPVGSSSSGCNQLDGQCLCKPDRGGRTCSDCEDLYWGNPNNNCYPCNCNRQGSAIQQCDRQTGQCVCVTGVTGYNCDRCARGTTGELPNCKPCGECFSNWDRVIRDLRAQTRTLISDTKNITITGAGGAFDEEFQRMQRNIDEIRGIIKNVHGATDDVQDLENMLQMLRRNLTAQDRTLQLVENEVQSTFQRVFKGKSRIDTMKKSIENLKQLAKKLNDDLEGIQTEDFYGAYNITVEAQRKSREAQIKVDQTKITLRESENARKEVDNLISQKEAKFNRRIQENERNLDEISQNVDNLSSDIGEINQMVCDGQGNPCDSLCGGAGCNKCGGTGCGDGSVTRADNALELAMDAKKLLKSKEEKARSIFEEVKSAKTEMEKAKADAQMTHEQALSIKNQSENAQTDLEGVLNAIRSYLDSQGATPAEIRSIAEETLNISISLTPEQIQNLTDRIRAAIKELKNIDTILNETKDDLQLALVLKKRADAAKRHARSILETADDVMRALSGAKNSQEKAKAAINKAENHIKDAQGDLTQIEAETESATKTTASSIRLIKKLQAKLSELRKKYTDNERNVEKAEEQALMALNLTKQAEDKAKELESRYSTVSGQLGNKYNMTTISKTRAEILRNRAQKLALDTTSKLDSLRRMSEDYSRSENTLNDLTGEMEQLQMQMVKYLKKIKNMSKNYRTCIAH